MKIGKQKLTKSFEYTKIWIGIKLLRKDIYDIINWNTWTDGGMFPDPDLCIFLYNRAACLIDSC